MFIAKADAETGQSFQQPGFLRRAEQLFQVCRPQAGRTTARARLQRDERRNRIPRLRLAKLQKSQDLVGEEPYA